MLEALHPREGLLHRPAFADPTWAETNWFTFIVPERNLRGHVYAGFRSNLGVVMSTVTVWSRDCRAVIELDYYDHRVHLPMPASNLDDYRLANGLHVRMEEPLQRWTVTYEGFQGFGLELEATAMMPAVTSHQTRVPDGEDFSHFHVIPAGLDEFSGHIDQTQMVRGEIRLRGETLAIAHPSNHDHSWSSRPEFGHGCGNFDEGFFGEEFAFHVQTRNTTASEGRVTNGYILDKGEVTPLKAGIGRYETDGWFKSRLTYELEDVRGRTYRFVGQPTATTILPTWPNQFNLAGLTRWTYEGESGLGEYKWHWETNEMQIRGGAAPASQDWSRD